MKIDFERTGGHLPIALTASLDTDHVTTEEAEQIKRLIAGAHLSDAAHRPNRQVPDGFTYKLSLTTDEGEHRQWELTDMDISDRLRPLVQWLVRRAKPASAQ